MLMRCVSFSSEKVCPTHAFSFFFPAATLLLLFYLENNLIEQDEGPGIDVDYLGFHSGLFVGGLNCGTGNGAFFSMPLGFALFSKLCNIVGHRY